jgi:hypothetical protein
LLRLDCDAKAVLQIQEVIAEALERCVVPLCVSVLGVLPEEVKHGCERAEVIIRPGMELDGFLGHASIVGGEDKIKIKKS